MPTVEANLTNVNYTPRGTDPTWIVIHNTANGTSREGTAYANTQYFKNVNRNASATYFIDDGDTVWQCVAETDTAWHCGESPSRNGCTNYNSIGIEVCETASGWFTEKEIETLRWLVTDLMDRYGIPASRVCRHHDVTGKNCPWYYTNDAKWEQLKAKITTREDDDDMTNDQIEKLAQAIADKTYANFSEAYKGSDDAKAVWGAEGKGKGNAYRNGYNLQRWYHDLLVSINEKLARIVKKLGA